MFHVNQRPLCYSLSFRGVGMKGCQKMALQCSRRNFLFLKVSWFFCHHTGFIIIEYIPTLAPPHRLSPPSMTSPQETHLLGQIKQTAVVFFFTWQGDKSPQSLLARKSYQSSPPFLFFFLKFCVRLVACPYTSLSSKNPVVPLNNILFFFFSWRHEKRGRPVHFKGCSVSLTGTRGVKGCTTQVYGNSTTSGCLLGQTTKIWGQDIEKHLFLRKCCFFFSFYLRGICSSFLS